MNRMKYVVGLLALLAVATSAAAQAGRLDLEVLDPWNGKPWAGVKLVLKGDQGQKFEGVTDEKGHYTFAGLRSGSYSLTFIAKEKDTEREFYTIDFRLASGQEERRTINFLEIAKQQKGAATEERKKQEEEQQKFESMKAHFDLGRAAFDQAKQASAEVSKTPPDQRAPLQQKVTELNQTAIREFQEAEKAATPKEENLHLVVANLAAAYESAGMYAEAADAFARAIEKKPEPGYFVGVANANARLGKVVEASAACDKIATLDPPNAATCWRNIGIVLYNSNKVKEAAEPLRKATVLDPKNPDAWYLLGASLLASIETKQVGDKLTYIIPPGTVEAYQKYLEIAPQGRFAKDAEAGLQSLEALGAGVATKVRKKRG